MYRGITVLVIFFAFAEGGKLPTYITQCKKSDPKFDECIVHAGNLAIPLLAKGDPHYEIPRMMPLRLAHAVLKYDEELKFILYNVEVHGIETANLTHAKLDVEEGTAEFMFNIPTLMILANNYEMAGRLLNISVFGNGFANITLVGGEYTYAPTFDPRTANEFDDTYVIGNSVMKYKTERTIYRLENMYNEDSFEGNELSLAINQHWEEVSKALRPGASKIMGDFIGSLLTNLANIVSIDEYFKAK